METVAASSRPSMVTAPRCACSLVQHSCPDCGNSVRAVTEEAEILATRHMSSTRQVRWLSCRGCGWYAPFPGCVICGRRQGEK